MIYVVVEPGKANIVDITEAEQLYDVSVKSKGAFKRMLPDLIGNEVFELTSSGELLLLVLTPIH